MISWLWIAPTVLSVTVAVGILVRLSVRGDDTLAIAKRHDLLGTRPSPDQATDSEAIA